ncbi:Virginiamycin B lyase [Planctomycetes bacterium CA13]|uniref:Virginiamycin B lyase n=1 Tax=Novipirellula herctigrandis TaxID=2527986 RepID=A0A5C5YN40_9BACT|nr:Virginiamycin B lyase [Planctomycetes bacterium CA13]
MAIFPSTSRRILSSLFVLFWLTAVASLDAASAQDAAEPQDAAETQDAAVEAEPAYPISVAVDGDTLYVVDLDLPGVWQITADERTLFVRGSNLLRKPLNRPRAIAIHPEGGILVGDSATREIYHITEADGEPKPLVNGHMGNAMAIAISPDKKTVYVGDAEKRSVFRFPIEGGDPELVDRVNARGLAFDAEGKLWANTPDDAAVYRIDVESNQSEAIVTGRPYQYPNGIVWAGEFGFVTDGYGKKIWKFTADGKSEVWHEGEPLVGPVGIAIDEESIYVVDPKQKEVYQFNRETKQSKPRM